MNRIQAFLWATAILSSFGCNGGTPQENPGSSQADVGAWNSTSGRWISDDRLNEIRFSNVFPPVELKSRIEQAWFVGGNVYVLSPHGEDGYRLRKVDGETGIELWSYDLKNKLEYDPTLYRYPKELQATRPDELFVVQSDGDIVHCIDDKDGFANYRIECKFPVSTAAVASQDLVFVGSWNKRMYALSKSGRHEQWSHITGAPITAPAAVGGSNVFFGSEDNELYCLKVATGFQPGDSWDEPTGGKIVAQPLVRSGRCYVGSYDYKVYCFEEFQAFERWTYPAGAPVVDRLFPFRDLLFAIAEDDRHRPPVHRIIAIQDETGQRKWEHEGVSKVLAADPFHCYGLADGQKVRALRMEDGKPSWNLDVSAFRFVLSQDADGGRRREHWGRIYLVSEDGLLQAIRPLR